MNQSQFDPTLKEHFTEKEAREWIRHLEKVIESLKKKAKTAGSKNLKFTGKLTYYRRKYNRLLFKMQVLQERHPEIDFGLEEFLSKEQDDG